MPPILHLCLFGPFYAELNTGSGSYSQLQLPTRQARALLARLAYSHPEPVARTRLVMDLFPGAPADRGGHHLRTTLYYVRRAIPGLLCTNESEAWLDRSLVLDMDVARFEMNSRPGATQAALEEAMQLYRGPFLDAQPEGWAEQEARRLYNAYLGVLQRLIAFSQANGLLGQGLEAARRWVAEEPWAVKAHQALIRAQIALEDYHSAEAQVTRARQILNGEWGQVTDDAFESLAQQVRTLAVRAHTSAQTIPSRPAPTASTTWKPSAAQIDFERLPLVGRAVELDQLWEAWMRAHQGQSGALVLQGPAGIGKTRLISELAARVRLQASAMVLWGTANESMLHTPLGLLRDSFARLTEADLDWVRQACAGLNPVIQSLLRSYIPELRSVLPALVPLAVLEGPAEAARRQAALAALAGAITRHEPLLFVLENTHLADEETLSFIKETVASASTNANHAGGVSSHCLVILICRPGGGVPDLNWPVMRISPLEKTEIKILLDQILSGGQGWAVDSPAMDKIAVDSCGNPLFAREILHLLVEQNRLRWDSQRGWDLVQPHISLPDSVAGLLAQRLDALSAQARQMASLLAVLGRPADEALLDRLFQLAFTPDPCDSRAQLAENGEESRLVVQVELLERQVLAEQGDCLWFDHDWLGETLLASLDESKRACLHQQIAQALDVPAGLDRTERMLHYLESGQWEPTIEDALVAGEAALCGQNLAQLGYILRAAGRALDILKLPPGDHRQWRYLRLAERYYSQAERGPAWEQALGNLLAFTETSCQEVWQVEALIRKASGLYAQGKVQSAIQSGRQAAQAARAARLADKEAEAQELLVSILIDWADPEAAWPECEALLAAAEASADERLQCLALNSLVQMNILMGKAEEAMVLFSRLAEHPYVQRRSDWDMLRQMAIFSMAGRAYGPGLAWLHASAQQAQEVGDVLGMVRSQAYLCFELANLGRYEEAMAIGESVLPLASQLKEAYQEGFIYYSMAKAALFEAADPAQALALVERGIDRTAAFGFNDPLTGLLGLEAQICLTRGWSARARLAVERAERLQPPSMVVPIDHIAAQVWLALGQREQARRMAHLAIERAHDQGFLAAWACEMLWQAAQVLEQVDEIGLAREVRCQAYLRFADDLTRLETPHARRLFIRANPAHCALAGFTGHGICRILSLPEPDAPTGRPLRADELVPVVWWRDAPGEPDLSTPPGRRSRLQRLCQDAIDQGAVATLEALAEFLAASPRTIQRDLHALREAGVKIQTRGGTRD